MAMAIMVPHYTVDDLATFPNDGNRYELLDGVLLVTPAPNTAHQVIATRFRRGWLRPCNGSDWRTSWVLASSCARRTRSYRRRTELPACRQIEHRKRIQRRCYPGFRTTVLSSSGGPAASLTSIRIRLRGPFRLEIARRR